MDETARLWDTVSGQELQKFEGHTYWLMSVAITPDGRRILTGGADGTARLWDAGTGRELLSLKGHIEVGLSVAVTPDGKRLVVGSGDGTASVWDAVSGRELLTLKGHIGPVRFVAVASDGRRIITGSDDGTVKIWEPASPEQVELWDKQDEEAARRQKTWQRPVDGGPGFIRKWLILAPLPPENGQKPAAWLEREQLPGEARLQPRAGDSVPVGGREYTWKAHQEKGPS